MSKLAKPGKTIAAAAVAVVVATVVNATLDVAADGWLLVGGAAIATPHVVVVVVVTTVDIVASITNADILHCCCYFNHSCSHRQRDYNSSFVRLQNETRVFVKFYECFFFSYHN